MTKPTIDIIRDIRKITQHIPPLVSSKKNEMLMKPNTLLEVEELVLQMENGKSPGPDGFNINFFHHFWDIIKQEVQQIMDDS